MVTSLDADVSFGPAYFDTLRREFEHNPRLGIAAGVCYELEGDTWQPVGVTYPNLRGAALTFRNECLIELLPLEGRFSWDGIVVVRANIRGWQTEELPTLSYLHHRPTGARDASRFEGFAEDGDSAYYMWYRPSYLLLRTLYRVFSERDLAATGLAWGYARSAVERKPRHSETGFREFVRSNQYWRNLKLRSSEVRGRGSCES